MNFKRALIPAAGRGARLDRPQTPKPLVDVGGEPLILRLLRQLEAVGVAQAAIVVGFSGKQIERALTLHPRLGIELEFVHHDGWEQGLASSVLAAGDRFDEPFLLAMADHFFDDALVERMARASLHGDALAVLADRAVGDIPDVDSAVKLSLDGDRVTASGRALDTYDACDAGLLAATPELFDAIDRAVAATSDANELSPAVCDLAREGRVRAVRTEGARWFDVDTPSAVIVAEMAFRQGLRTQRVQAATATARRVDSAYRFTTGAPRQTEVFVQRGFVRDPALLRLIPDDSSSSPLFVFTDQRVNELYGDDFVGGLRKLGYQVHRVVLSEREESKTLENYVQLVEQVLGKGIDERSILISLGGGAVCNVCGFVASTLYRGIGLIHVPTTLMAQCDAAISHKQGVNGKRGKNLVGSYYPPIAIAVDVDVLATLDDWLIPDGLSEVVKHALGQDPDYLDALLAYDGDARDPEFLEYVVRRNIELKCMVMADDPQEHRHGMVLQYGHTVGHPIEYLSGYDWYHGQAVAVGMVVAAHVSHILGGCNSDVVDLHRRAISKFGLPVTIPREIDNESILNMMRYNKRYLIEGTRMALVDRPGHIWSVEGEYAIPVSDSVLRDALSATRSQGK